MRTRSSSDSAKSNTSKFSSRRSWLEAFGMGETLGLVEQPAQGDLAGRLAVRLADPRERLVAGHAAVGERGVGRDEHLALAREIEQPGLAKERVVLDLVAEHRCMLERLREQPRREVRHAEVADPAGLAQLDERGDGALERHGLVGPVQQQEIQVVRAQGTQGVFGRGLERVRLEVAREDLRGEEDVRAVHFALREAIADLRLVLVRARGVDLPVADLERVADGLRRIGALDLPGPEAQPRHPRALDLDGLGRLIRCGHMGSPTRRARPAPEPGALLVLTPSRAISSAGRAPPRQGGGHWFEPSIAHLENPHRARVFAFNGWFVGPTWGRFWLAP